MVDEVALWARAKLEDEASKICKEAVFHLGSLGEEPYEHRVGEEVARPQRDESSHASTEEEEEEPGSPSMIDQGGWTSQDSDFRIGD